MWFVGYNLLLTFLFLATLPLAPILPLLGKRFSAGFWQRFAYYSQSLKRPIEGIRPVWIHAASVGEVRSTATLVRELKACHPEGRILLSTFTSTGNEIARSVAGVDAVIFLPMDYLWTVRRALAQWNPMLMIFVETEIWPNFLSECFRRGIPTIMVSGRLSARSYPRYRKFQSFFRAVLRQFSAIGMQTDEDAARMVKLGADERKVSVVGSLKSSATAPPSRFAQLPRYGKKLLVAGSTHAGEEAMLLSAYVALRPKFPELAMVLAPRHPQRFDDVEALLRSSGLGYCRRSRTPDETLFAQDILLLDTLGELGEFFACGDITFVGGSLVDVGGHNILEPARLGKAILFGPHMDNVRTVAEEFKHKGAAVEVVDCDALLRVLNRLLSDDAERAAMGRRALAALSNGDEAVRNNYALAARYLPPSRPAPASVV